MSEETVKRLGLATYDDLRYLLEIINELMAKFPSAPLTRHSYTMDDNEEYEILARCYAWIKNQSTGRMFRALMEGVDYTTMEGGE